MNGIDGQSMMMENLHYCVMLHVTYDYSIFPVIHSVTLPFLDAVASLMEESATKCFKTLKSVSLSFVLTQSCLPIQTL